jgi:hypothetical protein
MAGYAQDVASVLHRRNEEGETLGRMIRTRFGSEAWRALVSNANVMIQDNVFEAADATSKISSYLMRGAAMARLAYNVAVAFKQPSAALRVLPYSGTTHLLRAIGRFVSNPRETIDRAYALDPSLRSRSGDASIATLKRLTPAWMSPGFAMMAAMDRWAAAVGFLAVYDANIERGQSHAKSVSEAQRAINMTQNATSAKDKPLLWKQSSFVRMAMMFTLDAAKRLNIATYDIARALEAKGGWNKAKTLFSTAMGLALGALITKAIGEGTPFDDDTDEEWGEWIADAFTSEALSLIPIIGNEAVMTYQRIIGKRRNGTVESVLFAPFRNAADSARKFGDDDYSAMIWYATEALALATGFVPATGLKRAINSIVMLGDGEYGDAIDNMLGQPVSSRRVF